MGFLESGVVGGVVGGIESGVVRGINGLEDRQALICISHVKEEVPSVVRDWVCLPEAGGEGKRRRGARFGRLEGGLAGDEGAWREIWDVKGGLGDESAG